MSTAFELGREEPAGTVVCGASALVFGCSWGRQVPPFGVEIGPGATRSLYTCPREGNMPVRGPKAELLPIGSFWV